MNALELMTKAHRAVASAYKLLEDSDSDGARKPKRSVKVALTK